MTILKAGDCHFRSATFQRSQDVPQGQHLGKDLQISSGSQIGQTMSVRLSQPKSSLTVVSANMLTVWSRLTSRVVDRHVVECAERLETEIYKMIR